MRVAMLHLFDDLLSALLLVAERTVPSEHEFLLCVSLRVGRFTQAGLRFEWIFQPCPYQRRSHDAAPLFVSTKRLHRHRWTSSDLVRTNERHKRRDEPRSVGHDPRVQRRMLEPDARGWIF